MSLTRSNPLLVLNGDTVTRADLAAFLRFHDEMQARASIVLTPTSDRYRYGAIQLDDNGAIAAFQEKGISGAGTVSAGIYLIERSVLSHVPLYQTASMEDEIFPSLVGHGLYGFLTRGPFIDIGTPESYADAQFLAGYL
jgi:NDP-sugar pyrophosphorylase family protein